MFKFIKDGKIVGVSDEPIKGGGCIDETIEDAEHSVEDYVMVDDQYLLKEDVPPPTMEEQKEKRSQAYAAEVDPITAHIQRLRDEENPDEEKIAALIAERSEKVAAIKAAYTYPDEGGEDGQA